MPGLAPRYKSALSRVLMAAVLVVLPTGCAPGQGLLADIPEDSTVVGGALTPGSGLGAYLAARHAHAQRDNRAAADFYNAALRRDPDNTELLQSAFALMAAEGRMTEAGALAQRLVTYDPNASIAALLLSAEDGKAGDFESVDRRIAGLPKRGINAFVGPLIAAWAKVGQGKTDEAIQVLAPLSNNSHLATLHDFHAGLILDLAGRNDAAAEAYKSTLASPTGLTLRAVLAIGGFYQRQGKLDQAAALYDRYLLEHPDTELVDKAALMARGKDAPPVVANARQGMAEAYFAAATAIRQSNAGDVAMLFDRMALSLEPDFPLAQVLLADALQAQGRLTEANATYRAIDRAAPVWFTAQLRVAGNLDEMGQADQAISLLRELAQARKDTPDALVSLGEVLRKHERFTEATEAYDAAFARIDNIDSRHWALFYSRGISLERSKQWDRAEKDFLRALELEPEQPYVLNYLGYSWVEQGLNLDRARGMIEKAVSLRPNDGYIVDSLGWVLYRIGTYKEAARQLERAVELRPDDPTINDHLGDALWRAGRQAEARFQWQRAANLATDDKTRDEIRLKLTNGLPDLAATVGQAK
jgi:tetratricopeptide (TPR) repeat protein